MVRQRVEEQIGQSMPGQVLGAGTNGAKTSRPALTPRADASRAQVVLNVGPMEYSQSTLPGTWARIRIQTSNPRGSIL